MKARVKATGEMVKVFFRGGVWISKHDCTKVWLPKELTDVTLDIKEETLPKDNGDVVYIDTSISYWDKLTHQAAIAAMQGLMANSAFDGVSVADIATTSIKVATSLINRLKEEKK